MCAKPWLFFGQDENPEELLIFVKDGQGDFSQFEYSPQLLSHPRCFDVSPDLSRVWGCALGLQRSDLADFRPAFEHAALQKAKMLLAKG